MSDFLTNFEANLSNIHTAAGITDGQVKADILAQVKPLADAQAQTQAQIGEIQTALNDLETKLASGDTTGAQAALATAQTAVATATTPVQVTDASASATAQ